MVGPFTHMHAYLQQEVVIKKNLHLETYNNFMGLIDKNT